MGGTFKNDTAKLQHAMSKESLLKAPGKLNNPVQGMSTTFQAKTMTTKKPHNRLVPVPPPKGFLTAIQTEEPSNQKKIQNFV